MKTFLLSFLLTAWAALAPSSAGADREAKPNILLIVGDDMGYADVGFHGCKDIPTPHLDRLARSGVRFTDGYVSGPYCSPTRAALLAGRYQQRFGHEFNPSRGHGLPVSEKTLADRLKQAGYVTGLIGKWHLGNQPEMHPQQRGFDEFFGFLGGAHDYFKSTGLLRGEEPVEESEYLTDALARESEAFIKRHKERPWFLYLSFNAVHTPMQADEARLRKFARIPNERRRTYAAMMFAMDEAIGRVRHAVEEAGLASNTLVFFISDNGGPMMKGVTVNGARNDPFRGSKRTTLEGGIRVPMVIAWPGKLEPGVYKKPVIQLDLHATALAAAGVQIPSAWKVEGVDLIPHLTRRKSGAPHDALYWRFGDQMAIRQGSHKLVRYDLNVETHTGKKEPVSNYRLYDLLADPGESKDLSSAQPELLAQLRAKWEDWNRGNREPLWGQPERAAGQNRRNEEKSAAAQ